MAVDLLESASDYSSDYEHEEVIMTNNNQILRELAAPNLNQQSLCITFLDFAENVTFELISRLIHLPSNFQGLLGEEPHKHLHEFIVVCTSMKSPGVIEEQIKIRA